MPYPSVQASASSFYKEAIRHLSDSRALLDNNRYPAAVASAQKAQEIAVKAALIQENAMGFFGLFGTHKPLTDITGIKPLNHINENLDTMRAGLKSDAHNLEKIGTTKDEGNTEYPFYMTQSEIVVWLSPAMHFTETDAKNYYNVAREVVMTISILYQPDLRPGAEPIPDTA